MSAGFEVALFEEILDKYYRKDDIDLLRGYNQESRMRIVREVLKNFSFTELVVLLDQFTYDSNRDGHVLGRIAYREGLLSTSRKLDIESPILQFIDGRIRAMRDLDVEIGDLNVVTPGDLFKEINN